MEWVGERSESLSADGSMSKQHLHKHPRLVPKARDVSPLMSPRVLRLGDMTKTHVTTTQQEVPVVRHPSAA